MSYNINRIEGSGTNAWKYWVTNIPNNNILSLTNTLSFNEDPGMITLNNGSSFNGNTYNLNFTNIKTTGIQLFNLQGGILSNISIGTSLGTKGIVVINSLLDSNGNTIINTDTYINGNVILNKNINLVGNFISNLSSVGIVKINNTTQSNSTISGAITVSGGAGIDGNLYVGGNVRLTNISQSTSISTGALTVSGGVGIGANVNIGGNINFIGNLYQNDIPFLNIRDYVTKTYVDTSIKSNIANLVPFSHNIRLLYNINGLTYN
jgi:hypothetical protein